MATNITDAHRAMFEAVTSGEYENFALLSCFVNGEPASAIVTVTKQDEQVLLSPLFVTVTAGMVLTDHEGVEA